MMMLIHHPSGVFSPLFGAGFSTQFLAGKVSEIFLTIDEAQRHLLSSKKLKFKMLVLRAPKNRQMLRDCSVNA